MDVVGLDIGGANLKAAHTQGLAKTEPFALWRAPQELATRLSKLIAQFPPFDEIAVTMTGELCDCFETKRDGVKAILASVARAAGPLTVHVWSLTRGLVTLQDAAELWQDVASANWHAQASLLARITDGAPALLIDVGSTTTDIIPILGNVSVPRGWTDAARLRSNELCYTGVRRTPVCALMQGQVAAEWFATMGDVYLVLGALAEDPRDHDTPDRRPFTRAFAADRLARMLGGDRETLDTTIEVQNFAKEVKARQVSKIASCMDQVSTAMPEPPRMYLVSGSGSFLFNAILAEYPTLAGPRVLLVADQLGQKVSTAACAFAVAVLAKEQAR